ncbi:MAG: hypothetical protein M3R52_08270 [Acidobacteriota bacterium]|nr:hypothetical protein [Acidobacteriota bacterium]
MYLVRLAPLLILLCASIASAQDRQCTLKLSELPAAPELFGFRIGMTKDQVKVRVPQVVFGRTNPFGVSKTSINPDFDPRIDKSTFAGVRTVSLDFLDDRITSLWLGFDTSFKWHTVPEFVEGISQSLHLPDAWTSWKSRGQQLRCADFQMTVSIVAEGPSFRILDENAEETLAARRESGEEQSSEESAEEIVADRHSKIYYSKGCRPANEIKESDRVIFKKSEDAEKAGYKQAKQCQ